MGVLTALVAGRTLAGNGTPGPLDDFWYRSVGAVSQAGTYVTEAIALTVSAVFACVHKLAKSLEVAPAILYEEQADGGKRRAKEVPLYRLLHDQPNERQTAPEFWGQVMAHLAIRGNFYARKVTDPRGGLLALDPLPINGVTPQVLASRRRAYRVRQPDGREELLRQEDVFHVVGLSLDGGGSGVSVIRYARESFGLARATEDYAARLFGQGALHRGVVTHPARLSDEAIKRLKSSLVERLTGAANWHQPLVLEEGMTWNDITMTAEDAQLLLSRRFEIAEIARWFDVPLVLLHETDRTTSWGSGIAEIMLGYVLFCVLPWCRRIEAAIWRDLLTPSEQERLRAEFLLDALLRGDTKTRFESYALAIQNGIMSENEVRVRENLDPRPGLDEPRRSANQDRGGDPNAPRPVDRPEPRRRLREAEPEEDEARATRARQIALAAATAFVHQETAALRRWAVRYASDAEAWRAWVRAFYDAQAERLVERLALTADGARQYAADHRAAVLAGGLGITETWEREAPAALAALALEGATACATTTS